MEVPTPPIRPNMNNTSIIFPGMPFAARSPMTPAHAADRRRNRAFAVPVEIGKGQGRNAIDRPRRETPVEETVHRGPFGCILGLWLDPEGGIRVVVGPLDGSPVHDAGADAGAEQHRYPTRKRKLRPCVRTAEAHVAELAQSVVHEDSKRRDREPEVSPAERLGGPAQRSAEHRLAFRGKQHQRNAKAQNHDQSHPEDHLVNLGTPHLRSSSTRRNRNRAPVCEFSSTHRSMTLIARQARGSGPQNRAFSVALPLRASQVSKRSFIASRCSAHHTES